MIRLLVMLGLFLLALLLLAGCAHAPQGIDCKRVCDRAMDGKHMRHTFAYHDPEEHRCYCVPAAGEFQTCPEAGCPELDLDRWQIHQ